MTMLLRIIFALSLLPQLTYADLDESMAKRLDSDYQRITQIKLEANPKYKDIDELIAEKNRKFLEKLKKRVSIKDFNIVSKDIKIINDIRPKILEKTYLVKVNSTKTLKLSENNQNALNDLMNISSHYLSKGVELPKAVNIAAAADDPNNIVLSVKPAIHKNHNPSPEELVQVADSENMQIKKNQKNALAFAKRGKNNFLSNANDSLFNKISKAHHRNLEKVIDDDNDMLALDQ